LDGYTRWRTLHIAEREILPEGIRFATACLGAIHFERALIDGVHGPTMEARLGRLRNRIAVSQAVADLAAQHLGPPGSRPLSRAVSTSRAHSSGAEHASSSQSTPRGGQQYWMTWAEQHFIASGPGHLTG
jgi:hypothetical protein